LKFAKGDYFAGQQAREIPLGTKFVAIMDQLMIGWVKWRDAAPVEQIMGLLAQGYKPKRRSELDDNDPAQWETDDETGDPQDPWQFTNYLILADPNTKELYTFAASSRGALGAVGELCKEHGKHMREKPDEDPVIKLGVGSYLHRNKAYGSSFRSSRSSTGSTRRRSCKRSKGLAPRNPPSQKWCSTSARRCRPRRGAAPA